MHKLLPLLILAAIGALVVLTITNKSSNFNWNKMAAPVTNYSSTPNPTPVVYGSNPPIPKGIRAGCLRCNGSVMEICTKITNGKLSSCSRMGPCQTGYHCVSDVKCIAKCVRN